MVLFFVPIVMLAMAAAAHAQLSGLHVKGDAGLDSGTKRPWCILWVAYL